MKVAVFVLVMLGATAFCLAADRPGHVAPEAAHAQEVSGGAAAHGSEQHPALPHHAAWARRLAIGILALFIVAIPVGFIVRATAPRELPVTHSGHDEQAPDPHAHPSHGH